MRLLIVGSGGREHAFAWRLAQDAGVTEVLCVPGNPGMGGVAARRPGSVTDAEGLLALVEREGVSLTVVGPEAALDAGVADLFRARGHAIVGPVRSAAGLETSKVFAKRFMAAAGIPTARFVSCDTVDAALAAVQGEMFGFPVVIKADGLAGGKGVVIAASREDADSAVRAAMVDRQFGDAGATLVIEECLTGPEVSFFVLADGRRAISLGSAQDHKRLSDDDLGPNTGGMGAFAPSPLMTPELEAEVMGTIVQPVIDGLSADGGYRGFLYVSLMLTPTGPKVIEFNVRFGDPETQVVWPLLSGNLTNVLKAAAEGDLGDAVVAQAAGACVGVVLAAPGYPAKPITGQVIAGADVNFGDDVVVFHAGTAERDGQLITAGGRVLTVVARGDDFSEAMHRAYAAVAKISFEGMHYRRDIGRKAL
jgi:phosphoribosylamine--glycine ligase